MIIAVLVSRCTPRSVVLLWYAVNERNALVGVLEQILFAAVTVTEEVIAVQMNANCAVSVKQGSRGGSDRGVEPGKEKKR